MSHHHIFIDSEAVHSSDSDNGNDSNLSEEELSQDSWLDDDTQDSAEFNAAGPSLHRQLDNRRRIEYSSYDGELVRLSREAGERQRPDQYPPDAAPGSQAYPNPAQELPGSGIGLQAPEEQANEVAEAQGRPNGPPGIPPEGPPVPREGRPPAEEVEHRPPQGGAKRYCWTFNNPRMSPDEVMALLGRYNPTYVVFQREIGANGTTHYQGYVEFQRRTRYAQINRDLPAGQTIWFGRCNGTPQQNHDYCSDAAKRDPAPDSGPWIMGQMSVPEQGRRNDLESFITAAKASGFRQILESHPTQLARFTRFFSSIRSHFPPAQRPPEEYVRVTLLYGDPGIGKSRFVRERHQPHELYSKPLGQRSWFDGYDMQPAVLIDDFARNSTDMPLAVLLQLLDVYVIQVPTKGAFTWWHPRFIYLTSNQHPWEWYDYTLRLNQYHALCRRIHTVYTNMVELTPEARQYFLDQRPNAMPADVLFGQGGRSDALVGGPQRPRPPRNAFQPYPVDAIPPAAEAPYSYQM